MSEVEPIYGPIDLVLGPGHGDDVVIVVEVDESYDLHAFRFDSQEDAEAYMAGSERKSILIVFAHLDGGCYSLKSYDHT